MAIFANFRNKLALVFCAAASVVSLSLAGSVTGPLMAQQGPILKNKTAPAAESGPSSNVSADAKPVNIPVVVHDKHGAVIPNLSKDDFVLWVDKKPATIGSFDHDADSPLTVGLLVDVDTSQREAIEEERKASAAFLDEMLSDRDKGFVVQFARQTDLLQDVTGAKAQLRQALGQLATQGPGGSRDQPDNSDQTNSGTNNGGGNNGGNGRGRDGRDGGYGNRARTSGTVLYDALFLSSDELMSKQQGRKVLIVVSDGVDHASKESLASAIEAAQRADTIVYAIFSKDQVSPQRRDRSGGVTMGGPQDCDPYGVPGGYPGGYPGG